MSRDEPLLAQQRPLPDPESAVDPDRISKKVFRERLGTYLLGIAIGLVLVGVLLSMRARMTAQPAPPSPPSPQGVTPAPSPTP